MNKQNITEEMGLYKEWFEQTKKITMESLPEFLNHILNDYSHDYGTICHAITAGSIATANAMNRSEQGRITGFQAGFVMWGFIRQWNYEHNECGLKITDYDNMLYPQYQYKFEKTISQDTWNNLQKVAKEKLSNSGQMHDVVRTHLESIVDGQIPFGYSISED